MPAAAVIPAPIAYIKVVAVKKLVVEFQARLDGLPFGCCTVLTGPYPSGELVVLFTECGRESRTFTLKKLECLKQAFA